MENNKSNNSCSCKESSGSPKNYGLTRREFVKFTTSGLAAISGLGALPVMAGPFEDNDYLKIIKKDKNLSPDWVRSLFSRGQKQTYSDRKALNHIGMPVGGLFAGTVYLSGDGRLWLWDVFNRDQSGILPVTVTYKGNRIPSEAGARYIEPAPVTVPFEQQFGIRMNVNGEKKDIPLDADGFEKVIFNGRYPMGQVDYESSYLPLKAVLRAYSPFIPLNLDDSSLPTTMMNYTITNTSDKMIEVDLYGKIQNPVCMETRSQTSGRLVNTVVKKDDFSAVHCTAEPVQEQAAKEDRPDIVFEDFEKDTYDNWTVGGEAFGSGPIKIKDIPTYQGKVGGKGERVVNSHASAPGQDKDGAVGTLTSRSFTIERNYISFLIGGGSHDGQTCLNLLIDGEIAVSATGKNKNQMSPASFDVRAWQGKTAQLKIVDEAVGGWGNVGVDQIVFTDQQSTASELTQQRDYGSMALALFGSRPNDYAVAAEGMNPYRATGKLDDKLIGSIGTILKLKPGQSQTVRFAITWNFPNFYARGVGGQLVGHSYAARFATALDVAAYIAENLTELTGQTEKWADTWYDSTLPYWLLDRTMANTSTLATTTCYRFKNGRFWAWEGIGCCPGTCTHVWHYAQAPGRIFPELERIQREQVDFGLGQHADGGIGMRTDLSGSNYTADDGHCGRILGAYREHQMSADSAFLKRIWPNVKKAITFLIEKDRNNDGQIEGAQHMTLDAAWYGKISFLQSLYIAVLKAGQAMATEMEDADFAAECEKIAKRGAETIEQLYNGEYFIQIVDPAHKNKDGVGSGCFIDQIFGQSWAHQVALGRIFHKEKQLKALQSLWRYNFVPNIGVFRDTFKPGRWYAMAGDAGLLMCTWPKGLDLNDYQAHANECMSGFEWQVASHMIYEGMLKEGLAVARAIHDRYDASLRNPYNEIECSDHYARAMASYGAFISICGFEYHGPKGKIAFSPRLRPEDFKAAFISAEGWGTFTQKRQGNTQIEQFQLNWGQLTLKKMAFDLPSGKTAKNVQINLNGKRLKNSYRMEENRVIALLEKSVIIEAEQKMEIIIQC
jgi:non-lysosomal glucosylceramidase